MPHILLAHPRGFCAGVDRAINIVKQVLAYLGAPLYVLHEIVHNRAVVSELQAQGVLFVENMHEVPVGSTLIFSAHGIAPTIRAQAATRQLRTFDATCPLVTKVHLEIAYYSRIAHECLLIGHAAHPEIVGSLGYYDNATGGIYLIEDAQAAKTIMVKNPAALGYVTQTTLSVDDTNHIISILRERFPDIKSPRKDDICYATQNRQEAVKRLAQKSDLVLIVGSQNSSNSNRLKEVAIRAGKPAYLIDSAEEIEPTWLENASCIGLSAGASAPESLVQTIITHLQELDIGPVTKLTGPVEEVYFALPPSLRGQQEPLYS